MGGVQPERRSVCCQAVADAHSQQQGMTVADPRNCSSPNGCMLQSLYGQPRQRSSNRRRGIQEGSYKKELGKFPCVPGKRFSQAR